MSTARLHGGDDRDPLTVGRAEGLAIHEARHGPGSVLHPGGQVGVALSLGLGSKPGTEHGDDRAGRAVVHPIRLSPPAPGTAPAIADEPIAP
jgi:hypothetical protein